MQMQFEFFWREIIILPDINNHTINTARAEMAYMTILLNIGKKSSGVTIKINIRNK